MACPICDALHPDDCDHPFMTMEQRMDATIDTLRADLAACRNLIAVMHRDGGHYIEAHGIEKAVVGAKAIFHAQASEIAELTQERDRARYQHDHDIARAEKVEVVAQRNHWHTENERLTQVVMNLRAELAEAKRGLGIESDDDICGFCGKPGVDKYPHPVRWPGEESAGTEFVHAECETEECRRAHALLTEKQRDSFLRNL